VAHGAEEVPADVLWPCDWSCGIMLAKMWVDDGVGGARGASPSRAGASP